MRQCFRNSAGVKLTIWPMDLFPPELKNVSNIGLSASASLSNWALTRYVICLACQQYAILDYIIIVQIYKYHTARCIDFMHAPSYQTKIYYESQFSINTFLIICTIDWILRFFVSHRTHPVLVDMDQIQNTREAMSQFRSNANAVIHESSPNRSFVELSNEFINDAPSTQTPSTAIGSQNVCDLSITIGWAFLTTFDSVWIRTANNLSIALRNVSVISKVVLAFLVQPGKTTFQEQARLAEGVNLLCLLKAT